MKIYICVEGGIVCDVYAEAEPVSKDIEAVVLDVDKERDDAALIDARWSEIASDSRFRRVETEFYSPLEG